jgi:cell division protease FtsH
VLERAIATALGRRVITPPTAELSPGLIHRLYRQLARMEPTVVILDEAEAVIGQSWLRTTDADALRSLLAALVGINRPQSGPITLALTTADMFSLDASAVRPGRLAPHLLLSVPTADERRLLLQRAADGLPVVGDLDLEVIVERTGGWTGAELVTAVAEACSRSLPDRSDALRMDLLLDVIAERYDVEDEHAFSPQVSEAIAVHEAGHAIYAELTWPGQVAMVALHPHGGRTQLAEEIERDTPSAEQLRRLVGMSLAGEIAERLVLGDSRTTLGAHADKHEATMIALQLVDLSLPYAPAALEQGGSSDRGADAMRAQLHASVAHLSAEQQSATEELLRPRVDGLRAFARLLLASPDQALSGPELTATLRGLLVTV